MFIQGWRNSINNQKKKKKLMITLIFLWRHFFVYWNIKKRIKRCIYGFIKALLLLIPFVLFEVLLSAKTIHFLCFFFCTQFILQTERALDRFISFLSNWFFFLKFIQISTKLNSVNKIVYGDDFNVFNQLYTAYIMYS